ncbi:MAG TPA: DUF1501 domain-containing protein [Verrucomicrobiales bacterium]|nr:DUF1501 domain-containing protein [Verrucomicrobiales bacterium]
MSSAHRSYACSGFQQHSFPRRSLLRLGGAGLLGLTLPRLLEAQEKNRGKSARARSVIFLFQFGGPSQIDMFDMKPDAPDGVRSPLDAISTVLPGVPLCAQMPRMARALDKVCLVRSIHHEMTNHNSASYYALTGHAPPVDDIRLRDSIDLYPAYGSVVDHLTPPSPGLPNAVAFPHVIRDGSITPGQSASFLGRTHDPFLVTEDPNRAGFHLPELSLPEGLSLDRLQARRGLQQIVDSQSRLLEQSAEARGLDTYYQRALAMLQSETLRDAFDLSREPDALRDAYGRHTFGQSCLLARRLAEAGSRFVTVYFSNSIGGQSTTSGGWDTHGFNDTRMYPIIKDYHLPITDQTLPTFLTDLDERGLLDETLVVWMGEFGRTPRINGNASRDHWPHCYTALLAGGGVKRGFVFGASDEQAAYPAEDPVRPDDLAATMFHLLGIDPQTEVRGAGDRPLAIASGEVISGILA